MRAPAHWVLIVLATALLASCGAGRNFTMPADGALKLGFTTPQDAVALLGEPLRKSSETVTSVAMAGGPTTVFTAVRQPGTYDDYLYAFIDTSSEQVIGPLATERPQRLLRLIFWNGKLVAYIENSSFKDDSTDFDDSRVTQIVRDKSTAADVIALMGKPAGSAIFPLIAAAEGRSLIYNFGEDNLHAHQHRSKFLAVYVDGGDIVRDMHSEDTTNPLPALQSAPAPMIMPIIVPHGK